MELLWDDLEPAIADDPSVVALAISALLGGLRSANVTLRMPDDEERQWAAARSGLPFAVVNRDVDADVVPPLAKSLLSDRAWRRSWTPATRSTWVALLGDSPESLLERQRHRRENGNGDNGHGGGAYATGDERHTNGNGNGGAAVDDVRVGRDTALFGPTYASFVNAHRSRRPSGSEHVVGVLTPWLSHALSFVVGPRQKRVLAGVRVLVDELVQNVRGHALNREDGLAVHSLVRVVVHDRQRLVLTVQDTGPGIPTTARPKLAEPQLSGLDDHQLVRELLAGTVEPWGRARGIGLPKVLGKCKELEASLAVLCGTTRARYDPDVDVEGAEGQLDVDGTLVVANIPLQGD